MSVIRQPGVLGQTTQRRLVGITSALSAAAVEAFAVGIWFALVAVESRSVFTALAGLGVLLFGYVFFGGPWDDPLPWLLSLPFLVSILPAITLAGVPDVAADRAAGKDTIAVRFGVGGAAIVAAGTTILAAALGVAWHIFDVVPGYGPLVYLSVPHAALICWLLHDRLAGADGPRRIDALMATSLAYIVWFGVVALLGLR